MANHGSGRHPNPWYEIRVRVAGTRAPLVCAASL